MRYRGFQKGRRRPILCSSNSGSAPSGMKDKQRGFQDVCVASCRDESGGFNCGQTCIRGTSSLILEWHEWLTWLSYHAAGLPELIAELLISQNREKKVFAAFRTVWLQEVMLAVYSGNEIPWKTIPQPDCIPISVVTTRCPLHLEIIYCAT